MARRWGAVGLLVALLGLSPPAAAQEGGAFPDGEWEGVLVYSASLAFAAGGANASGDGSFTLTASGGTIEAGSFSFRAVSDVAIEGGTGSVTATTQGGTITGPAGAPLLSVGGLHLSGSVTVQGITVPVDITIPESETGSLVLTIDAVGCDRISGDMSQQVAEQISSAGVGVPQLVFRWSAVRSGADPAVTDALADAVDAADKLVAAAARGDLDPAALGDLLGEADAISAGLPSSGDCPTQTFSTPLSGAIVDLLSALASNPASTLGQLWGAVNAGVRTGVLVPGTPLHGQVAGALADRLAGADVGAAYTIHLAARALGDDELAAAALEVAGG